MKRFSPIAIVPLLLIPDHAIFRLLLLELLILLLYLDWNERFNSKASYPLVPFAM